MRPNFICAGFAKCGTTTLYNILKQHKDIRFAKDDIKEPNFFSDNDIYNKGVDWYETRYYGNIKKKPGVLIGEINPYLDIYVERVRRVFNKNTKFIFIMRNPVDVGYSAYKFYGKEGKGFESEEDFKDFISLSHEKGFENYIKRNLSSKSMQKLVYRGKKCNCFLHRQNYYQSIKKYLKYYPEENFKFIIFEEFVSNPKKICEELYEFLGSGVNLADNKLVLQTFKSMELYYYILCYVRIDIIKTR